MFYNALKQKIKDHRKALALLIDPDKQSDESLLELIQVANTKPGPDLILVGGSIVFNGIEKSVAALKKVTDIPVYIFPGSALQVVPNADGILLLSLISGRNPEFLIGNHVQSAPLIKKYELDVISTGYLLINSGIETSVQYMSNTSPIPYEKSDIAVATALAGEQLGLQQIYLEAGSGAEKPVSVEMISAVKENTRIPLIVGGGIRNATQLTEVLAAGADMVVVGTATEKDPQILTDFAEIIASYK